MFPYIGTTPWAWRNNDESFGPEIGRWAGASVGAMFGGLFTGFLQRGFVLYASQLERLRTTPGLERLTSRNMATKGLIHTLVKAGRTEGAISLIHGISTLCLLAPINMLGGSIMTYYFFDIGKSATVLEDVQKAVIGLSAVVACEYIATPLRTLYLLQASTPVGSPCIKTREFQWSALKRYRPGMNTFVLSSAIYALLYLTQAVWESKVTNTDPYAALEDMRTKEGRYLREEGDVAAIKRFTITAPVFLLASTFTWLVGLRQFLNYHHHDPEGLLKDVAKPSIYTPSSSPVNAKPMFNPRLRYTSALQPWLHQLRVGPRAIFLGVLSSFLIWPPGPYVLATHALFWWNHGFIEPCERAKFDAVAEAIPK